MPRKLIKRYCPSPEEITKNRYLKVFGKLLHDPNLWHFNRRSISSAFANGLFWAMIPMPLQMVAAAISAIIFRTNIPIAVALVWLTNPLTMPPLFYFEYLLGTWMLGIENHIADMEFTPEWLSAHFDDIWIPLFSGAIVTAVGAAILGYFGMRMFWRWHVIRDYRERRLARKAAKARNKQNQTQA